MRKKDEMEQQLANKAIKITWFVTVMVLFIIGGYQSYVNGTSQNIFLVIVFLTLGMVWSLT